MSLVGKWTLSDANYSGGAFQDLTSGNHDGVPENAPNFTTNPQSLSNRAVTLNGTTDAILIPDFDPTGNSGDYLSAFTWIKGASQDNTYMFAQFNGDAGDPQRSWGFVSKNAVNSILRLLVTDSPIFATAKDYRSSIIIGNSAWHQIGFTWNAGVLKLYIDGVEDTSVVKAQDDVFTSIYVSTSDISIGSTLNGLALLFPYAGDTCFQSLFDSVLSDAQILANYNEELSGISVPVASAESNSAIKTFGSLKIDNEDTGLITRF